jgi:hypothetical protein
LAGFVCITKNNLLDQETTTTFSIEKQHESSR